MFLQCALRPRCGPTVQWCSIDVLRAWRCGFRDTTKAKECWLEGPYFDVPEEWNDPYRLFRW
jgi:hypothetical protein